MENFRSYRTKASVDEMPEMSILIGRNNAGKSNLIKAIDSYKKMENGHDMPPRFLHTGNTKSPLVLEIEYVLDSTERDSVLQHLTYRSGEIAEAMKSSKLFWGLKHYLRLTPTGILDEESVAVSNFSGNWLAIWGCTKGDSNSGNNTAFWQHDLHGAAQNLPIAKDLQTHYFNGGSFERRSRAFQWAGLSLPMSEFGNILRAYVQKMLWIPPLRQASARIGLQQDMKINPSGDNVVRVLNTVQGEDPDLFKELMKEVIEIIPDIERIRTPSRGGSAAGIINEPGGVEIELDEAGTGMQQTLILVNHLMLQPPNSLLFIEEPEIGLNASAQRALFRLMKRLANARQQQMVITTHSTIFTESSERVATYLLDKKEGVSTVRRLQEPAELRQIKQALGHENTDLFGYNAVLIVEGDTEEKCLPLLAQGLDLDLVRLGIRVINIGGTGAAVRIDKLLDYVADSDTVPFVMLDDHSPAAKGKDRWIAEKIVDKQNVVLLPKEFEDCFDDKVLAAAVASVANLHGSTVNITDAGIAAFRTGGKAVVTYLEREYFQATGHSLSKPELGLAIGELLAKAKPKNALTRPEEVLKTIQQQLGLRQ
jgi:putative ATP-dependent endonuclease of the OLD family